MAGCSHNDSHGGTKLARELHVLSKFPRNNKWTKSVNWQLKGDLNENKHN